MTIAYLRVSTGKQHPENQKEEIEKFAARKNLTVNRKRMTGSWADC